MSARLLDVSLDDKYRLESGRIYVNGTQALARLPFIQRRRDARAGLHTAGFISGYRGSPLGSFDQALWQAQRIVADFALTPACAPASRAAASLSSPTSTATMF